MLHQVRFRSASKWCVAHLIWLNDQENVHENWCSYLLGRLVGWLVKRWRARATTLDASANLQFQVKRCWFSHIYTTEWISVPQLCTLTPYTLNYTLSSKTQFILDKKSHSTALHCTAQCIHISIGAFRECETVIFMWQLTCLWLVVEYMELFLFSWMNRCCDYSLIQCCGHTVVQMVTLISKIMTTGKQCADRSKQNVDSNGSAFRSLINAFFPSVFSCVCECVVIKVLLIFGLHKRI